MNIPDDLVYIDAHGLLGSNFYWDRYETHGLSKEDIIQAGLTSGRVQVSEKIIPKLVKIDTELQKNSCRLYVKEGYRSEALYRIVYQRRVEKYGKEVTDSLLNMDTMPHALGLTVDVALWNAQENKEVLMRRKEDGVPALFLDFYKNKEDEQSRNYQTLQEYLVDLMMQYGFRIGVRREYFHFDYRPQMLPNYP